MSGHVADDGVESDCEYCGVEPHSGDCPLSLESLAQEVISLAILWRHRVIQGHGPLSRALELVVDDYEAAVRRKS